MSGVPAPVACVFAHELGLAIAPLTGAQSFLHHRGMAIPVETVLLERGSWRRWRPPIPVETAVLERGCTNRSICVEERCSNAPSERDVSACVFCVAHVCLNTPYEHARV